jgi:Amino acid synthesis
MPLDIRKLVVHLEEIRAEGGRDDAGGPLRKAAAMAVLGAPVESYGKAALVGLDGEQEHANACITGVFGDALREAVGGGKAWLPSVTKRVPAGAAVDIPVCYRDAIWVRSHYDAVTVAVPDAPLAGELVVGLALTNRGRLNARLGGLAKEEVVGQDGLR